MMNPTKLKTLKPIPDTKSLIKYLLADRDKNWIRENPQELKENMNQ